MAIEQIKFGENIIYIERFTSDITGICNFCVNEKGKIIGAIQMSKPKDERVRRLGRMCDKCFDHFCSLQHKKKFSWIALKILKRK